MSCARRCALASSTPFLAVAFALILDATSARANFGTDPYTPVMLSAAISNNPTFGGAAADGSGGMYVVWSDAHGGTMDVYLQRLTSTGAISSGWPAGGLRVCSAAGAEDDPSVAGDGAGGAYVAWDDARGAVKAIYASRFNGSGVLVSGWSATGTVIGSQSFPEYSPKITPDGAGGAFVAWSFQFSSADIDIYGAHLVPSGVAWSNSVLYSPVGAQLLQKIIGDGAGGFLIGFTDNNNANSWYQPKVMRFSSSDATVFGPILGGSGNQILFMDIAYDGNNGVYVVSADNTGFTTIVGSHVRSDGSYDPSWSPAAKVLVPETNVGQNDPVAAPDGAGGLLVAFLDGRFDATNGDLFLQRIGPFGLAWAGWPAGGVAVSTAAGRQIPQSMVPDGSGGAVVSFADTRAGVTNFLYAAHVLGSGAIAPGWSAGGNPIELGGAMDLTTSAAVSDGQGGALFAWRDFRNATGGNAALYAQNMDQWGQYGDARPFITKIADVPNDQGGEVSLQWSASYLDANPSRTVMQYSIWRRVPGGTAAEPAGGPGAAGAPPRPSAASQAAAAADGRPALRVTRDGTEVVYWEYLETQPARMLPGYSAVVATTQDSTGATNPRTSFMIDAESAGAQMFWAAPPDSGYSVDNIAPYAPSPFVGTYSAGTVSMHWSPVIVPDLDNYRLYRGSSASFVPSPSNHIGSPTDTTFTDSPGAPYYYRLTAVDIHGNEGPSTLLLPQGSLGVGHNTTVLSFAPPAPNPAHASAELRFGLPHAANVRLALYDVNGRRMRLLAEGPMTAGDHAMVWDLRDDAGRPVGTGLYFARFETEGHVFTHRLAAIR